MLVTHVINKPWHAVLMDPDLLFTPQEFTEFDAAVARLVAGEPIQYILGDAHFDGLTLFIGPGALIPRPETEELVTWAADDLKKTIRPVILDICTGSGCIALALKHRLPHAQVIGLDISEDALFYARKSAEHLGLDVRFETKDIFTAGEQDYAGLNAIVCNPPYIPASELAEMHENVLAHEPSLALFVPDHSPLLYYIYVAQVGLQWLSAGGGLWFEIHEAHGPEMEDLLKGLGYVDVTLRQDMQGKDRMIFGRKP